MNKNLACAWGAAALLLGALPAAAAPPAPSWYIAPEAIYLGTDRDRLADDDVGGALSIGRSLSDQWDAELSFGRVSPDAQGDSTLDITSYFANFHRVFYRSARISPYLKMGVGYVDADYNDGALAGASFQSWTWAYGVGLLANLTQNESRGTALALRAEIYGLFSSSTSPPYGDHLNDTVAGLGLQYQWGAPVAAVPVAAVVAVPIAAPVIGDADGDGVNDNLDKCPGTPAGTPVNADGCELDTDGDGVVDRVDRCPATPPGEKVDEVGCAFRGRLNVFFDNNSATLKPESFVVIDELAKLMVGYPETTGEIEGHTDSNGSDVYNLDLSQRRADAVRQALVERGIAPSRLTAKGFGESRPEADNATAEGRAQNRRVIFQRTDRRS